MDYHLHIPTTSSSLEFNRVFPSSKVSFKVPMATSYSQVRSPSRCFSFLQTKKVRSYLNLISFNLCCTTQDLKARLTITPTSPFTLRTLLICFLYFFPYSYSYSYLHFMVILIFLYRKVRILIPKAGAWQPHMN